MAEKITILMRSSVKVHVTLDEFKHASKKYIKNLNFFKVSIKIVNTG